MLNYFKYTCENIQYMFNLKDNWEENKKLKKCYHVCFCKWTKMKFIFKADRNATIGDIDTNPNSIIVLCMCQ